MFENLSIKYLLKIENLKFKIAAAGFFILLISISAIISKNASAASSYVLPYPSVMPGSKFYEISLIWDEIRKYWYFGDFGQFHYNLKQSDKYLVEAKTLFDYKQYLLAKAALEKSDKYFEKIYPNLLSAKNNSKNISEKEKKLKEAVQKHIEELKKIKNSTPSTFDWTPEQEKPTRLNLWGSLDASIRLRKVLKTARHSELVSESKIKNKDAEINSA